eukprot:2316037-Pleurochrysis_carterae.AAC.2
MESREEGGAQNDSHRVGEEARLVRQGQPMDEVSSVARNATKNLQDHERGGHVPAPQRVLGLRLLERGGQAYDGGKQARLSRVFVKAKAAPRVRRGARPVGIGLKTLSSKSSWCCVAVCCARHSQDIVCCYCNDKSD